jgi:hypothetical protein
MKLVHYSSEPLGELRSVTLPPGNRALMKPAGLWVSDDACEDNWPAWCAENSFGTDRLTHAHDVELAPGANVLILSTPADIDAFGAEWCVVPEWAGPIMRAGGSLGSMWLDWPGVMERYDGLIITPYVWERRMDAMWYYGWDCASGCIWHPRAIASVKLRDPAEARDSA